MRNVLSNWGGFLFTAVVSFFLGPYILAKLGTTPYGIWQLTASLVGYLGLLDLGVRGAVTKFIATYHSAGKHESASDIKSAALLLFTAAGFLAVIVAVGISLFVDQLFSIPEDLKEAAQITIVISGINIGIALITGVYGGILAGRHRFDLLSLINVMGVIFRSAAVIIALEVDDGILTQKPGQGVILVTLAQLLSSVIQLMLTQLLSRNTYREALTSTQRAFSAENMKKLLSFGLISSVIQALAAIAHNSALILIGSLLPVAMVTYYSIATMLTEQARTLMSGISYTIPPLVAAMEGAQQSDSVRRIFVDGTRYTSLIILPIVATFIIRGESFVSLWMGVEYGKLSGQILSLLSVALWAMIGYQTCTTVMLGLGKHKGMVPIMGFEALMNIGVSIMLIQAIGVLGSAWGSLIARLFVALVMCVAYARKVLHISIGEYYMHALVRPIIAIAPFAAVSYGIEITWPASNLAVFFLQVTLVIPVAILGSWIFGLKSSERNNYIGVVRRRVSAYGRAW